MRPILLSVVAMLALLPAFASARESKYYEVPKGDYPHDVAAAPSGEVWYAGQKAGIAGRLDPVTGRIERIPLGKNSAPQGVIVGPDGAPWFTDGGRNAIVRVDPATKEVKAWSLPPERMPNATSTPPPSTEGDVSGSPARSASTTGWTRSRAT